MSRIIAGSRKGRRVQTPPGDRTRPTADRVREAVFSGLASWLGSVDEPADRTLAEISFIDAFAGSGAMALEAASRGAHRVLAIEADRRTADLIRQNAADLGLAVEVIAARVESVRPERIGPAADVLWLDPPYDLDTDALVVLTDRLVAEGWLLANGLLVVERATRDAPWRPPSGWESWTRSYGETIVFYAQRAHDDEEQA